ncbi:MAG: glycosyltransferase family 2 protein [Candidatus Omnitrophota bacterium]
MTRMKKVSIIIPCYNEERFISRAIETLVDDFVMEHAELLIVDGLSTDRTPDIITEYIQKNFPIRYLKNENKLQCFGLNLGISEANGDIIIRADAHSTYPDQYVKRLVELLETTDAINVGGVMVPRGHTPIQQAIALAMGHPVGVGNAKFHLGNFRGPVDTVYLGAFHKRAFEIAGKFDTRFRTNEDAELNLRLRKAGEKIYLDSSIRVDYLPRDTFPKLAVQYFRYGMGRAFTTLKHRQFTSLRQVAPLALVVGLIASAGLSRFSPWFLLAWAGYLLSLLTAACFTWRKKTISIKLRLLMTVAFFVMHTTWGAGFLWFLLTKTKNIKNHHE